MKIKKIASKHAISPRILKVSIHFHLSQDRSKKNNRSVSSVKPSYAARQYYRHRYSPTNTISLTRLPCVGRNIAKGTPLRIYYNNIYISNISQDWLGYSQQS